MGRRKTTAVPLATREIVAARLAWLEAEIGLVSADLDRAVEASSHQAVMAAHRQRLAIRDKIDEAKQALADLAPADAEMSPRQMHEYHTRRAAEMADVHLQLYVVAYLRAHRGLRLVGPEGRELLAM